MKTIQKWRRGLGSAFIGGGAAAVTSTFSAAIIAPNEFNPLHQLGNFLLMAVVAFLINGFLSAMFYLRQAPLPPEPED